MTSSFHELVFSLLLKFPFPSRSFAPARHSSERRRVIGGVEIRLQRLWCSPFLPLGGVVAPIPGLGLSYLWDMSESVGEIFELFSSDSPPLGGSVLCGGDS